MERFFILILSISFSASAIFAQNPTPIIQQFLDQNYQQQQLEKADISNWEITSYHKSSTSNLLHAYIQQTHQGIKIANGIANFAIKDGQVISMGNRLVQNLHKKTSNTNPKLSPTQAIQLAAQQLGIQSATNLKILKTIDKQHFIYNHGGISKENIPLELMYYATSDNELVLVWDLSIYTLDAQHWWSIRIDAQTGLILDKNDWVIRCDFDHSPYNKCKKTAPQPIPIQAPQTVLQPDQYTVFALPTESPNHGSRSVISNPADAIASPYGWHDTNGVNGPEYTITRGNNVYAYEDSSNTNNPGFSPDGGATLEFNFPYNPASFPYSYQSAAITNLFYTTNMMHDIWYRYGFDEASGNFQTNNYNNGGLGGDHLIAEAQDSRETNNASITVSADGISPRMELFLWNVNVGHYLTVNSPSIIARSYNAGGATFGSILPTTGLTTNLVLVEDATFPVNNACEALINNASVNGKIALIQGDNVCPATTKVEMAQNAGAVAAIVISSYSGTPVQMTGTNSNITIPSIQISAEDGDSIKTRLLLGPVNVSIGTGGVAYYAEDSDLDNGIIAHEYAHGISTRLTGGSALSNCLSNTEHIGEGLSDWFALMMTIEQGDLGSDPRGFATYSSRQSTTGQGIRPTAYSTDFSINPYTYNASNNLPYPHGSGFIYGTVLWDLTWALINEYGGTPDLNLHSGTGGNNIAMNLIVESLKLQPCNPGMIDGRDAILKADSILYNGANQCIIWRTFAARGLGLHADQGFSYLLTDQIENFDVPTPCQIPTLPPIAAFTHNNTQSCIKTASFTDNSSQIPQSWQWDFGDGNYSNLQNPVHNYDAAGTYLVRLVAANSLGNDTTTQTVVITTVPSPIADDLNFCLGDSIIIPAIATGIVQWTDTANQIIDTTTILTIPNGTAPQTYYVQSFIESISQYIGPPYKSFNQGAYISQPSYHRVLNFRANNKFKIISARVYVGPSGLGPRTFYLSKGINNDGSNPSGSDIEDYKTINFTTTGGHKILLNFTVSDTGYYNIGGNSAGLFSETSGANYPYILNGYMTIDSSSNASSPTGHYYALYNIEIRDLPCESAIDTVNVTPVSSNFSYVDNGGVVHFTDASLGATSWLWDFGDNTTSYQQNPIHTYTSSGNYTVTLTINNGLCSNTQTFSIAVGTNSIHHPLPNIKLQPNPAAKATRLLLEQSSAEDLLIELVDINGKILQERTLLAGSNQLNLDLSLLPASIYFVRIKGNSFLETRKLVVE